MTSSANDKQEGMAAAYANQHIPAFLSLPFFEDLTTALKSQCPSTAEALEHPSADAGANDAAATTNSTFYSCLVQVVKDGSELTTAALCDPENALSFQQPILVADAPESIGMQVPADPEFGIREVSDIVGAETPVRVIDVGRQQELEGWSLGDLVDYFEDEDRLLWVAQQQQQQQQQGAAGQSQQQQQQQRSSRRQRRAAAQAAHNQQQVNSVLNQISLEFSKTPLRALVQSPACVRELDWIDTAWPAAHKKAGHYPAVQFYCLTSAAGCFTDFHVDFGGTSVWYHLLSGQKQFCLIPPTRANLKAYEDWLCSPNQADTFLPNALPHPAEAFRLTLRPHHTLLIPSGWIHAVYTSRDALVLGGNFLHGLDVPMQIEIFKIETKSHVLEDYRVPYFIELHFCAAYDWYKRIQAVQKLKEEDVSKDDKEKATIDIVPLSRREWMAIPTLCDVLRNWWEMKKSTQPSAKQRLLGMPTVPKLVGNILREAELESLEALLGSLMDAYNNSGGLEKHLKLAALRNAPNEEAAKTKLKKAAAAAAPTTTSMTRPAAPSAQWLASREKLVAASQAPKRAEPCQFRITLSAKSQRDAPTKPRQSRRQSREGISSFPEAEASADDEWVPEGITASNAPKEKPKKTRPSPTARKGAAKKAKTAGGSARQRLFKKTM